MTQAREPDAAIAAQERQRAETLAGLPRVDRETTARTARIVREEIALLIEEQRAVREQLREIRADEP